MSKKVKLPKGPGALSDVDPENVKDFFRLLGEILGDLLKKKK